MRQSARIPIIEGMRGLAAISVALYHLTATLPSAVFQPFHYGWLGVDAFFVISGFVIPLSLFNEGYVVSDFGFFMLRRCARIEPPYLVSVVMVVVLAYVSSWTPGLLDLPLPTRRNSWRHKLHSRLEGDLRQRFERPRLVEQMWSYRLPHLPRHCFLHTVY